ncbi:MAG: hypothetical protein R2699_11110 [Acidimicrobiales bacterium]
MRRHPGAVGVERRRSERLGDGGVECIADERWGIAGADDAHVLDRQAGAHGRDQRRVVELRRVARHQQVVVQHRVESDAELPAGGVVERCAVEAGVDLGELVGRDGVQHRRGGPLGRRSSVSVAATPAQ